MPDAPAPPSFMAATELPVPSADRLSALWSFTRAQQHTNPTGYENNVQWWGGALGAVLRAGKASAEGDTLVLRLGDDLLARLDNGRGARPRGIAGVVDSLTGPTGPFVPSQRFMDSPTPIKAGPSIASRIVGMGWGALARLSPFGGEATEESLWKGVKGRDYVHLPNVEMAASAFEERTTTSPPINYTDALYTRASFLKEFAIVTDAPLTKRDVDVLLRWLARDVGSVVADGDVIKLLTGGQVPSEHPITEADRGAVSVKSALASVDAQIEAVEAQAAECHAKAKRQLALGNRTTAASYLRSKKQLDEVLSRRIGAGEQLRAVLRSIDQAKGDAEVMSAYEASTAALASALADPRLSPDRIAATTDALADALADQKEIDDAIQLGGKLAGPEIDEDELADELAALVLEEKEAQERREKAAAEAEARAKLDAAAAKAAAAKEEAAKVEVAKAEAAKAEAAKEAKAKAAQTVEPAAALPDAPTSAPSWEEQYEEAQARERAEKARAEAERLKKDEARLPAF